MEKIKTNATNRRIREIISAVLKDPPTLIPRPDFQRRLVWTNRDRIAFIETVLKELPFPEIYVCAGEVDTKTAVGTEWLVDGQQRVSTLVSYFRADPSLRLNGELPPYALLPIDAQKSFLEYTLAVRDLGNIPLATVREVFERINSTKYGLNAMEMANARYDGAIKKFAEQMASNPFYAAHEVFTPSDIRRMADMSFQLSLVITLHAGYFDDITAHEQYLERYNEDFPLAAEMEGRLQKVFDIVDIMKLPPKCRWWKKADIFSLLVELDVALHVDKVSFIPIDLSSRLQAFEADLLRFDAHDATLQAEPARFKDLSSYSLAAAQGSTHRKNRITRGEVLSRLIRA